MELHHLRYFAAIAEALSVAKAAQRLPARPAVADAADAESEGRNRRLPAGLGERRRGAHRGKPAVSIRLQQGARDRAGLRPITARSSLVQRKMTAVRFEMKPGQLVQADNTDGDFVQLRSGRRPLRLGNERGNREDRHSPHCSSILASRGGAQFEADQERSHPADEFDDADEVGQHGHADHCVE